MAMLLRRSKITAVTDAITYSTSIPVTAVSTIASTLTIAIAPETIDTTHIQRWSESTDVYEFSHNQRESGVTAVTMAFSC